MSEHGIKISKPGKDVKEAKLKDLLVYSKYPLLKMAYQGSGSINYTNDTAGTDALVVTHDLGYVPLFMFYTQWYDVDSATKKTTYISAPFFDGTYADLGINFSAKPYASTTELRYEVYSNDGNGGNYDLAYFYAVYFDPDA